MFAINLYKWKNNNPKILTNCGLLTSIAPFKNFIHIFIEQQSEVSDAKFI